MSRSDWRRRAPGRSWFAVHFPWDFLAFLLRSYFRLLYRLRATGAERIPREGPLIFVSNHQSHYDPPLIGCVVHDRPCGFLARKSLFRFGPFAALIRLLGTIPLDREGSGAGAIRSAAAEIDAGRCLLMFPEGTRTRDGSIRVFKAGVLLLVRKTRPTVVPVAIDGLHEVWPPGRRFPRLHGRIAVGVGAPIGPDELLALEPAAAMARLQSAVEEVHREIRAGGRPGQG